MRKNIINIYFYLGAALKTNDFKGCELYLSSLDDFFQTNSLWEQLALKAMELDDLNVILFLPIIHFIFYCMDNLL